MCKIAINIKSYLKLLKALLQIWSRLGVVMFESSKDMYYSRRQPEYRLLLIPSHVILALVRVSLLEMYETSFLFSDL